MIDTDIAKDVKRYTKMYGGSLIAILQGIQGKYRYIPEDAIRIVSKKLNLPLIDVYGVITFYNSFSLKPIGKYLTTVCLGTACHVRGGKRIVDALSRNLEINPGETTKDLRVTLQTVNCLGCCAIGPIVVINGEYHGQMNSVKAVSLLKKIQETGDEKITIARRARGAQKKNIEKRGS